MKKISNFMIFSMFLTVVGAPAMSMTSHTIKADDAQKKKRRKIALGVGAGLATIAAGAAAYKYRNNISNAANQMFGKSAQTKDTQTKTTSPERRDATKQVKTENKPMETRPETATNNTVPVSAVPTNSKTVSQSEAPQTRAKTFEEMIRDNDRNIKNAPKAPKFDQEKMLDMKERERLKTQNNVNQASTKTTQVPKNTAAQAPANAPQSNAPQTSYKTRAEMERDGDLVYNAQGAAGNKNAPQAPKFDPEKMQKKPNIATKDSTKTTQVSKNTEAPAQEPAAPAPAKTLAQQLEDQGAKLKPLPPKETAADNAAAAAPTKDVNAAAPAPVRVRNVDAMAPQIKLRNQAINENKRQITKKDKKAIDDDSEDDDIYGGYDSD